MNDAPAFYYSTFATPLGDFSVAVDATGAAAATAFGGLAALAARAELGRPIRDDARLARVRNQVESYFVRGPRRFAVPWTAPGTAFQRRVWRALEDIPSGQTRSYGELARLLGSSARAVGRACAANPVCLIVPCHRVVGADGALTGFAFGEAIKRRLLEHEGRRPS
jgi:methylated-DNA-[protein]-cysteine S-methyltransferase